MIHWPRLLWRLSLASGLGVHVISTVSIVLAATPLGQARPGLFASLPILRTILLGMGASGAVGIALLTASGKIPRKRGALGTFAVALLLVTGTLYGCARTVEVKALAVSTQSVAGKNVFSHEKLDGLLATYVNARGMVDYHGLKANRALLDEYVGQVASASPRSAPELFPTEADRMAYWINAYNALMLRAVIDHYPIQSVADILVAHGVFSRLKFPVGGESLTLDDIEKGILLKEFGDPRVHFALTCASMSCPKIDREAFRGQNLSERLDAEGRDFLRSPSGVQVGPGAVVRLTSYFKWYASDFGPDPIAFVRRYLDGEKLRALDALSQPHVEHMSYDWRLNDAAAPWADR
ncbi:MAG: DUF547 domain-containing protein [Deltaproteobacteria bacterium]|nr:DUF547 domain-containing protein [Deltaproteobacteria bacterium]